MDQVKEKKMDKQQVPAATTASSSSSASCSSSSSASSPTPPHTAQQPDSDHDGEHDTAAHISLPLSQSADATHLPSTTDQSGMETSEAAEDQMTDGTKAMDVEQQEHQLAAEGQLPNSDSGSHSGDSAAASSDPARMTDDLASSLSSASLTSFSTSSAGSSSSSSSSQSSDPPTTPTTAASDTAATDSSSSSSLSSSTTTSELATAALDEDEQRIAGLLKQMHIDVKKGEASVRAVLKMLQNLQKAPSKPDNRKMRKDNMVVKKNVVEVAGALSLLELVGYRCVELNGHQYIAIDDAAGINSEMLEKAIKLLLQYQERQVEEQKKPASVTSGTRVRCAGGCGYWGDSSQESLCSLCYKKKYLGATAATTASPYEPAGVKTCLKQCGLFGSDKFSGMCSQCFAKEKAAAAARQRKSGKQRWLGVSRRLHALYLFSLGKQEEQANKGRCFVCTKRLPVPIECRCRRTFCSAHRFPLDHQCSYDAQSEQKKRLRRQLIHVQTSKMDRI